MILRAAIALVLLIAALPVSAQDGRWATAWATAPMAIEDKDALSLAQTTDATIRQTVLLTLPAKRARIRITNRHGNEPLQIAGVRVARAIGPGSPAVQPGSDRTLSFGGQPAVTVPMGAEFTSDPVEIDAPALSHLAITIHYSRASGRQTGHPGSRTRSHVKRGNALADANFAGATDVVPWFHLAAVEVEGAGQGTIALLGDSITDGYGVKPDSDTRWPDFFARALQASPATKHLGVANLGIGGNRLLLDGLGPNALARFDRDVLGLAGVRYVVILIGVNDLGTLTREGQVSEAEHAAHLSRLLAGFAEVTRRARERGIRVIGGTILPYGASEYYHPDPPDEAKRQAINAWLRAPGNVDAVIDFDVLMRDPKRPDRLRAAVDSGDGLHPSAEGYRAMAAGIPLELFAPTKLSVTLTFDDLPEHGPFPEGEYAIQATRAITTALKKAGVRHAYGFVNGAQVDRDPALVVGLTEWRKEGFTLANHGWSHARLDDLTLGRFAEELSRNESALGPDAPRYFRYPFLAEGRDPALRDAARRTLADRGYAIAPVDIDWSDWAYNGAYARCTKRRDRAAIARLEAAFLADAEAATRQARATAQALYGREIPYVVLLHSGAFTARMLPRLLELYDGMEFFHASMEEALFDPAHAAARNPGLPFVTSTLGARSPLLPRQPAIDVAAMCADP